MRDSIGRARARARNFIVVSPRVSARAGDAACRRHRDENCTFHSVASWNPLLLLDSRRRYRRGGVAFSRALCLCLPLDPMRHRYSMLRGPSGGRLAQRLVRRSCYLHNPGPCVHSLARSLALSRMQHPARASAVGRGARSLGACPRAPHTLFRCTAAYHCMPQ